MKLQRGLREPGILSVVAGVVVALVLAAAPGRSAEGRTIRFGDTRIIIEFNATAQDVGIQVFLDGEPWKEVTIVSPDGRTILDISGHASLSKQGLTELFFESSEPSLADLPLEEFLARFPEGKYKFFGTTVEGDKLVGTATLSHKIPDGPVIVSTQEGATVDPDNPVMIEWESVTGPPGIQIKGYQVIVERAEVPPRRVFSVDVSAETASVTVPPEFLEPGTKYKIEVLAIEAGGNQTISEGSFETE